jgi:spore maturation protein CgeB
VREADLLIVGSYVPDGVAVARWALATARGVTAFYDIDTPVTLEALARDACPYLSADLVRRFDLYLSFTGGPTLARLERQFGARRARALYCAVDPDQYYPGTGAPRWDLGYMGTYSADRQPVLERLLLEPARQLPESRFTVVGPQYADDIAWPANVTRRDHLAPAEHRAFYTAQRFTLNVTRAAMTAAGYSPSVRLFEAAACATPVISDAWPGLDDFFVPGQEILVADSAPEVMRLLRDLPDAARAAIGRRARERVLAAHTAGHRAAALEGFMREVAGSAYPL